MELSHERWTGDRHGAPAYGLKRALLTLLALSTVERAADPGPRRGSAQGLCPSAT